MLVIEAHSQHIPPFHSTTPILSCFTPQTRQKQRFLFCCSLDKKQLRLTKKMEKNKHLQPRHICNIAII